MRPWFFSRDPSLGSTRDGPQTPEHQLIVVDSVRPELTAGDTLNISHITVLAASVPTSPRSIVSGATAIPIGPTFEAIDAYRDTLLIRRPSSSGSVVLGSFPRPLS